jgi:hypothetical protein
MGVPFFSWRNGEAIELSLGIGELNSIAGLEIPLFRHMRILGETERSVGRALYRLGDGTVTPLP